MSLSKFIIPLSKATTIPKIKLREGENRVGQLISIGEINSNTRFAILGIPEHIGVLANMGASRGNGTQRAFQAFTNYLISMPTNQEYQWQNVALLGHMQVDDFYSNPIFNTNKRQLVSLIDSRVCECIRTILDNNIVPIVIGGGHNNAFPIIKAVSEKLKKKLSVVNFDAHGDIRKLEGRHSGNPFSYAYHEKLLNHYAICGFNKIGANDHIMSEIKKMNAQVIGMDAIISQDHSKTRKKLVEVLKHFGKYGLEIDTDVMKFFPSNALYPTGLNLEQMRSLMATAVTERPPEYLHISEAAPLNEQEDHIVGSSLSILIADFINAHPKY